MAGPSDKEKPTLLPPVTLDHARWSPSDGVFLPRTEGVEAPEKTDPAVSVPRMPRNVTLDAPNSESATPPPLPLPADLDHDLPLPQVPRRYAVQALLGRGGMGAIWRVHDARLRRDLAMKVILNQVISGDALTRFAQEAQVTGQLEHPNIVPVHDMGRTADGAVYFTMKLVRGRALSAVLAERWAGVRGGQLSYERVVVELVSVMIRVCEAMAFAHTRGVVHRDLKPDNVMVGEFGEVQVMDWGLARLLASAEAEAEPVISDRQLNNPTRTHFGRVAGTPSYMAPEQARGEDGIGPAADVWALGALLYEVLCGHRAFDGSVEEVLVQVADAQVRPPSSRTDQAVSRELEQVVLRAMAADPADRYASAQAMAADLTAWSQGDLLDSVRYSQIQRLGHAVRRHRAVITAVSLTSVVAVVLLGWLAVRYVQDLNAALDVAQDESSKARAAEQEARVNLAESQAATADALVGAERFMDARRLYEEAMDGLDAFGQRTTGARLGLWSTVHLSRGALGHLDGDLLLHDGRRALLRRGDMLEEIALPTGQVVGNWPAPAGEILLAARGPGGLRVWVRSQGELALVNVEEGRSRPLFPVGDGMEIAAWPDRDLVLTWAPDLSDAGRTMAWTRGPDGGWDSRLLSEELIVGAWNDEHAVLTRYGRHSELWDLRRLEPVRRLSDEYAQAAFSPDGRAIVMHLQPSETLRAEDVLTGEARWTVPSEVRTPRTWSEDGRLVFVSGLDPGVVALDAQTGARRYRLDGDAGAIRGFTVHDGIALGSSAVTGTDAWVLPGPDDLPLGQVDADVADLIEVDLRGDLLAWVDPTQLHLHDLVANVELPGIPLHTEPRGVRLDAGGGRALVVGFDGSEIIDLRTGARTPLPVQDATAGAWLGDDVVAVGRQDGSIVAVGLDGVVRWESPREEGALRWDLVVDRARGRLLATAFHTGRIDVLDPDSGAVGGRMDAGAGAYTLTVDPQTGRVVAGTSDRLALVFGADGGEELRLDAHDGPVLGQALSPDGTLLATADFAGLVRIFDLSDGGRLLRADGGQAGPAFRIWWPEPDRLITVSGESVLVRDLTVADTLAEARTWMGRIDVAPLERARGLALHGLDEEAARALQDARAPALDRMRAWYRAGDATRAREALGEVDFGDGPGAAALSAGWQTLLQPRD